MVCLPSKNPELKLLKSVKSSFPPEVKRESYFPYQSTVERGPSKSPFQHAVVVLLSRTLLLFIPPFALDKTVVCFLTESLREA
ncbi:MAG: hypothetical protein JKY48_17700 [Flavobacteriales bacterium]|nr:hypothetical protein [Flavobacteriales bacterium]